MVVQLACDASLFPAPAEADAAAGCAAVFSGETSALKQALTLDELLEVSAACLCIDESVQRNCCHCAVSTALAPPLSAPAWGWPPLSAPAWGWPSAPAWVWTPLSAPAWVWPCAAQRSARSAAAAAARALSASSVSASGAACALSGCGQLFACGYILRSASTISVKGGRWVGTPSQHRSQSSRHSVGVALPGGQAGLSPSQAQTGTIVGPIFATAAAPLKPS